MTASASASTCVAAAVAGTHAVAATPSWYLRRARGKAERLLDSTYARLLAADVLTATAVLVACCCSRWQESGHVTLWSANLRSCAATACLHH